MRTADPERMEDAAANGPKIVVTDSHCQVFALASLVTTHPDKMQSVKAHRRHHVSFDPD